MPKLTFPFGGLALTFSLALTCWNAQAQTKTPDLTRFIDPRVGVLGGGSCVIGPSLPFGSIHPSPDTPDGGYDGYRIDRPIRGFSQLHVSGTGWGQYGNFLVSPQIGLTTSPTGHDSPKTDEVMTPFEYQARLSRYDILAQVAPTHRAAIYRFTFPASDQAHIVWDASQSIPADIATNMKPSRPVRATLTMSEDGRTVMGSGDFPGGFGGPYRAYFCAEFDHAPASVGTWRGDQTQAGAHSIESGDKPNHVGGYLRFNTTEGEAIQMKIGVSFTSAEKARESLHAEIPGWNYDTIREQAHNTWQKAMGSIETTGGTDTERTLFYTSLFHVMVMPRDRTGEFARFAPTAPMWDDHYAIWDTWRTLYPLLAVIRPDVVRDTVNSFIERQRVDGAVPDTFIAGVNQFREQGGNGVDMIIADAQAKGVTGIDWEKAYEVLKYNADHRRTGPNFDKPELGPGPYRQLGWIPSGIMSCSMTLEYAYNDFAAAQVAASLGKMDDAARYFQRSRQWENLWNPEAQSDGFKGFIMPRNADKTWVDFDTKVYPGSWKNYFYEGNSWTYSYFAPHQPARLVELMGGPERFVERLEYAFDTNLIIISNEPAFLTPQLFHYAKRPDLSSKWLHKITTEKFNLRGYPGDDDSGAMSSYYIWSKLGLFPNAGQSLYFLNGPAFEAATIKRPGQPPLEIHRTGQGIYIASVRLNGKPLERSWIRHSELNGPSRLDFVMSETPTQWARQGTPPPSLAPAP